MARVGVIADTHGHLDARIGDLYADVDLILHGGDVGDPRILEELSHLAPVIAVRGNVDEGVEGLEHLPEAVSLVIGGVGVWMTHILQPPAECEPGDPVPVDARVVIFGHSHLPHLADVPGPGGGSRLWFNPASAGRKRFRNPRLTGLLRIDDGVPRAEHLDLEQTP